MYKEIAETIKENISNDDCQLTLNLSFILYIIFMASSAFYFNEGGMLYKTSVSLLIFSGLIFRGLLRTPLFWGSVCIYMVYSIFFIFKYYLSPNHYFVLTYWSFALFLSFLLDKKSQVKCIKWNALLLFSAAIGISVFQKCISKSYIDGSFFYFMFEQGEFFSRGLLGFIYGDPKGASLFTDAVDQFISRWDNQIITGTQSTVLPVNQRVLSISMIFAWLTLTLELILTILFLRNKYQQTQSALALLIFAPIILFFGEVSFGMMMCLFVFTVLDEKFWKMKSLVFIFIFIAFVFKALRFGV